MNKMENTVMKKSIFAISISLASAFSWGADSADAPKKGLQEMEAKRIELSSLLLFVAKGVSQFSVDAGCVPRSPVDLVGKPSKDRLKELGCKEVDQNAVSGDYIPPSLREATKQLAFVRRPGQSMVIEYTKVDGIKAECTFRDADSSKCELGSKSPIKTK